MGGEVRQGPAIKPVHNSVVLTEVDVEKGAKSFLHPVTCSRQQFARSDEIATEINSEHSEDTSDAVFKALAD